MTKQRNEEDTEVQDNLERFDRLKKQMTQLSALSTKWAALQEELVTTEYNMALLLKEMGVHETAWWASSLCPSHETMPRTLRSPLSGIIMVSACRKLTSCEDG